MHDSHTKVETPVGTTIVLCPVCSSIAELYRYSEAPDAPTTTAVMCSNGDRFGPQDGLTNEGCLLYLPPDQFYRGTIREAVKYWNQYACVLEIQRRSRNWEMAKVLRATHATPTTGEKA